MFFLPISDDNPIRIVPLVTWLLLAVNVVVFVWQVSLTGDGFEAAVLALGMTPAVLFGYAELPSWLETVPAWATPFTSMFMHGGWAHLGGNMLYLWIFANNVEESMGHGRFIVFYLITGVAAAFGQALADPISTIPMVGASGAISGMLGAYLMLHPRAHVRVLVYLFPVFLRIVPVPALIVLGLWFLMQIGSAVLSSDAEGGVAFWAHSAGFAAGMVLVPLFKHRWVPLFAGARRRGPWG